MNDYRLTVDKQRLPNRVWTAMELTLPVGVAENRRRALRIPAGILLLAEKISQLRLNLQHLECVSRKQLNVLIMHISSRSYRNLVAGPRQNIL